jgi:adenine-specific DNA-methyltransferase
MPTLEWIGKDKVINHHQEVPFRVLEHKYTYTEKGMTDDQSDSGNKIIRGDNLEALKSLLPQYEGRVKCIYIDPPYNTGNEGWVYNDNVNDPKIKKWLGDVVGKEGEDLSRHDKWLCMMYPRLKLLQRLLADDGAIFISIDDNEYANLKILCDEIFGARNFITSIIWQKRKGGGNDSFYIGTDHEYILVYIKNANAQIEAWRIPYEEEYLKRYKYEDDNGKYYYDTLSRPGLNNPIIYDVECPDGTVIKNGTWQISQRSFLDGLKTREVGFIQNKTGGYTVVRKVRMPKGRVFRSIITDFTNKDAADEMEQLFENKKAFSTPKPSRLIIKLLELCIAPDSIILDSFSGSGTTAHAVLNMNKADGGNRKFILVEMMEYAESITAERVRRVIDGYADVDGTGGNFSFYELGEPLLNADQTLNESVSTEKIRQYVFFMETKRPMSAASAYEPYLLGSHMNAAYYFIYEKEQITALNYDFLATVKTQAEGYVMYADLCTLSDDELLNHHITFKKIPRDISRL